MSISHIRNNFSDIKAAYERLLAKDNRTPDEEELMNDLAQDIAAAREYNAAKERKRLQSLNDEEYAEYRAKNEAWRKKNQPKVNARMRHLKHEYKKRAVEYFGGKCMHCGGVFPPAVYDFHHRTGETKEASPSKLLASLSAWETVILELRKCDMICANCHRIEHFHKDEKI